MVEISAETWKEILERVKEEFNITQVTYRTWLEPLTVYEVKNNTVVILVTTGQMGIDYISKFMSPLKAAIAEITGTDYGIEFILPKDSEPSRNDEASRMDNKLFEQVMEKIDALEEKNDRAHVGSILALTVFGAVSLAAICVGWSRH